MDPGEPHLDSSWGGIFADEGWLLAEHVQFAVEEAAHLGAALVFSGGQTRQEAGPLSEGQSYFDLAATADWWGHNELEEHALVEGFARDSMEQVAFGLARFHEVHSAPPSELIVFGWRFKRERFELHRQTLGWSGAYQYVGVNDPSEGAPLEKALKGEADKCAALADDPRLQGDAWQRQRESRDPFGRGEPYSEKFGELCFRAMG
jgi:hypothetical protein